MEKLDPYKHKEKYFAWKERIGEDLTELSENDRQIFIKYMGDMENGLNVASSHKKGARSYIRLNTIRVRILFLMKSFESAFGVNKITEITEEMAHKFFNSMRNGQIKRKDGKDYTSVKDYVQDFKAFWHWWIKISKKQGIEVKDITSDLDTSVTKPKWVYLTEDQVKLLADNAKNNYKILIWFLFDTGMRAPTEVSNIKVSDFYNDFKELNIRQEVSKTFGRRIKLMICSKLIKEYVELNKLSKEDYLLKISPRVANIYLKRLAFRFLGDSKSPAGEKYSNLTMYDLRHCSCCYWLPKYKSESALKYRFGWKESDKIHYYSELLGMRDTISEEDLLTDLTKTEIEQKLVKSEKERELMQERMRAMELELTKIKEFTNRVDLKVKEWMMKN